MRTRTSALAETPGRVPVATISLDKHLQRDRLRKPHLPSPISGALCYDRAKTGKRSRSDQRPLDHAMVESGL